jgi:drug/metabolite transporter (DMT)-like permease
MPILVFAIVLFAAALHASWNAIVKGSPDKLLMMVLVTAAAALIAVVTLPWLQQPATASWPFLLTSSILQVIYFVLVARTYHIADMSEAYPLMRGTAPLLVTLVSVVGLKANLSPLMWVGVTVISLGILSMAWGGRHKDRRGIISALLNAVVIAAYTLTDGMGVRRSGAPAAYTLWIFLIASVPLAIWAIRTRRRSIADSVRNHWHFGLIGGIGTVASYGLALWAMTLAPIAVVAALRETSILFGTLISGLVLKERISVGRFIAAGTIALGAAVLRLA